MPYGWKTITASLKEFKGKALPLSRECFRRKDLEKLCDIYKNFVYCTINATIC